MSIEERRMDLAVEVVERAMRQQPEAGPEDRLSAFGQAYQALSELDAGQDDWTEDLLVAAWTLVEDAWPRGGPTPELVAGLVQTFEGMQALVEPPPEARRSRPRRDARG